MNVLSIKTILELSPEIGYVVFSAALDLLKQEPSIQADPGVQPFWENATHLQFSDYGVAINYTFPRVGEELGLIEKWNAVKGFKLSHASFPLPGRFMVALRQKLAELAVTGGTPEDNVCHNLIMGSDKIMVERFNAITDNTTLYFENAR